MSVQGGAQGMFGIEIIDAALLPAMLVALAAGFCHS
jgi:hypothetical protein